MWSSTPGRRSHASREHRGVRHAGPRGGRRDKPAWAGAGGGCRAAQGSAERCPGPAGFPLAPSALRTAAGLPDGSRRGDRAGPAGRRLLGRRAGPGPALRRLRDGSSGHGGRPRAWPSRAVRLPAAGPLSLQVTPAPYQLPSGLSREVVLPHGPDLLIAGGLTLQGTSTAAVRRLNPSTGSTTRVGRLAVPTHDAAGATIGGRTFVFGGGEQGSAATVQEITVLNGKGQEVTARGSPTAPGTGTAAGRLPRPRSDLTAVTQGGTTYLLGGYDGTAYDATVLATTDGRRFTVAARLAVPVRYPAVAVLGGQIWVFGGQTSHGITNDIQRISLPGAGPGAAGQTVRGRKMTAAAVAGHLPEPTTGAAAFTLGGAVYVAGGQTAPARPGQATASPSATLTTSRAVIRYQPGQPAALAGSLPVPVANAGAGVVGGTAFLVGGDDGKRPVPTVTEFRLVSPAAAIPPVSPGSPLDARSARALGGGGGPAPARHQRRHRRRSWSRRSRAGQRAVAQPAPRPRPPGTALRSGRPAG